MERATIVRRAAVPLAIGLVGLLIAVLADGTAATIGVGLIGVAVVLLIAWVFLEVGLSEDRAREQEQRARGPRRD